MGVRRRVGAVKTGALLGAALVASLSLPVEQASASERAEVTVMTQNLYLGSSLQPALDAKTPAQFVGAVALIYSTMLFTDFPARAAALADTIASEQPDIIGLQEVSKWVVTTTPTHDGPTPPSLDFLAILQAEAAARGLDYEVAAFSNNAEIGPAPLVLPLPLPFECALLATGPECEVTLLDRDVILVNRQTPGLDWSNPTVGQFAAQQTVTVPTGAVLSFDRGWAAIDATYQGRSFRLVNTHLEVEAFENVQEAQAAELLAGPMRPGPALIAVGDFNSAADGSTTDTYDLLTRLWLTDVAPSSEPSYTCCQDSALLNPVSQLTQRIDLVLTHGAAHGIGAEVITGDIPADPPPFWASDHAGVIATVEV